MPQPPKRPPPRWLRKARAEKKTPACRSPRGTPANKLLPSCVYWFDSRRQGQPLMMGQKLKITGWVAAGAVAGVLTTVSLQTVARGSLAPLPLEELQQLAAVFGMVKSDYVEPVDEKKLIS